ncbi:META domain protein [Marinobacter litoralis]|uniref:META domain protein n=1 Tax=Marinobacter litoralis TaxID=187981 RepID=A0A3M2RD52_9GAMM|nr:META domain-containing protein [Marinobacter litoralis]RMJ03222.1 META domain protein [Marinobacter litoralis]
MLLRRALSVSAVVAAGIAVSACATKPEVKSLSDYGVYQCGQLDLKVAGVEESGLLGIEYLNRRVLLKPSPTDEGALYVAPGDTQTRFWAKGERATFTLKGNALPECLEPGAIESSFKAMGTEPNWSAEIENNRMDLTLPYDGEVLEGVWLRESVANRHGRVYEGKVDEREIEVSVAHQLCENPMSGAQYPAQVRLTVDGNTFEGCGGDRERLFQGAEWVVDDLAGDGIIDRSMMTIRFHDENRISGRASCNRYMGSYSLTGENLTFGQMGSTMMACHDSLMNQERKFLTLMSEVVSGHIGRHGELLLKTQSGDTIKAFKSDIENP